MGQNRHATRRPRQVDRLFRFQTNSGDVGGSLIPEIFGESGRDIGDDAFADQNGCEVGSPDYPDPGLLYDLVHGDVDTQPAEPVGDAIVPLRSAYLQLGKPVLQRPVPGREEEDHDVHGSGRPFTGNLDTGYQLDRLPLRCLLGRFNTFQGVVVGEGHRLQLLGNRLADQFGRFVGPVGTIAVGV